jgi:LCP family protein required for cell wall assembly
MRSWFRTYVVALGVSGVVVVSGLVGVNIAIDRKINNIERVDLTVAQNTEPGEPANFLLIGSDTRAFVETDEQQEAFGDPTVEGGQRSDTIMVVHVEPEQQTGVLVSFPRDLVVDIPGIGQSKINAAFNEGPQLVIDTLKQNFDIDIHHYLEVDFSSFEGIVSAIGGVPIYFSLPARDEVTGFHAAHYGVAGCYTLDGPTSLAYVRSRHYEEFIDGEWQETGAAAPDLFRIQRQQAFMRRLAVEAVKESLNNPLAANTIADEALAELKADDDLSRTDINKLISAFRSVDPNDPNSIQMLTVPTTPAESSSLGQYLELNETEAEPIFSLLRQTTPAPDVSGGPAPAEIRVRVFNGSGVTGLAAPTSDEHVAQGFVPAGIGDNPEGGVDTTQIRYRSDSADKAEVVQAFLGGVGELVEDDSIVEADVQVVLGPDFQGVTPAVTEAPVDTAPTTAAPPETGTPETVAPPEGEPVADPTQC